MRTSTRKCMLWIICISTLLLLLGWLWLYLSWSIPGFGFSVETENGEFFANISFIIGYAGIFISLALLSKLEHIASPDRSVETHIRNPLDKHNLDAIGSKSAHLEFNSFPKSRLIAGLIFLGFGLWTLLEFGYDFGRAAYKGEWFTLSGPSVFYAMGVIPSLFGIGLVIYSVFAAVRLKFMARNEFIEITESRGFLTSVTTIKKSDILAVELNNIKFGPKLLWIVPFSLYIVLTMTAGLNMVSNPLTFGYGWEVGTMYVVSGLIGITGLSVLLVYKQDRLILNTVGDVYELQCYLSGEKGVLYRSLTSWLGFETSLNDNDEENLRAASDPYSWIVKNRRLLLGLVLLITALISRILMGGAGNYVRWILFMFGGTLLFEATGRDRLYLNNFYVDNESQIVEIIQSSDKNYRYVFFRNSDEIDTAPVFSKLNFFDVCYVVLLFAFVGWQFGTFIFNYPTLNNVILQFSATCITLIHILVVTCAFLTTKETEIIDKSDMKHIHSICLYGDHPSLIEPPIKDLKKKKTKFYSRILIPTFCLIVGLIMAVL